MKFKELFEEVEDWFWKLEFNPETSIYELYLGIPNDWVYGQKGEGIEIELVHQLEDNSIIKITTINEELGVDDIIDTAKILISKNKELEKRKEEHRLEMQRLADLLVEKEKSFLEFIDQVKDGTVNKDVIKAVTTVANKLINEAPDLVSIPDDDLNDGVSDAVNDGVSDGVNEKKDDFIKDIEKLKLT